MSYPVTAGLPQDKVIVDDDAAAFAKMMSMMDPIHIYYIHITSTQTVQSVLSVWTSIKTVPTSKRERAKKIRTQALR